MVGLEGTGGVFSIFTVAVSTVEMDVEGIAVIVVGGIAKKAAAVDFGVAILFVHSLATSAENAPGLVLCRRDITRVEPALLHCWQFPLLHYFPEWYQQMVQLSILFDSLYLRKLSTQMSSDVSENLSLWLSKSPFARNLSTHHCK